MHYSTERRVYSISSDESNQEKKKKKKKKTNTRQIAVEKLRKKVYTRTKKDTQGEEKDNYKPDIEIALHPRAVDATRHPSVVAIGIYISSPSNDIGPASPRGIGTYLYIQYMYKYVCVREHETEKERETVFLKKKRKRKKRGEMIH